MNAFADLSLDQLIIELQKKCAAHRRAVIEFARSKPELRKQLLNVMAGYSVEADLLERAARELSAVNCAATPAPASGESRNRSATMKHDTKQMREARGWMIEFTPMPKPLWFTGKLHEHRLDEISYNISDAAYKARRRHIEEKNLWGKKDYTLWFTDDPCKGAIYLTQEAAQEVLDSLHVAGELMGKDCYRITEHEWSHPSPSTPAPDGGELARQEMMEDLFNRQTYVIEYLQDVGRGKKPIPTTDECKRLAVKLGKAKWRGQATPAVAGSAR